MPFLSIGAITSHITYVIPFLVAITGRRGTIPRVRAFGKERVLQRLEAGATRKDLFYHLVRQHMKSDVFTSQEPITEWRGAS